MDDVEVFAPEFRRIRDEILEFHENQPLLPGSLPLGGIDDFGPVVLVLEVDADFSGEDFVEFSHVEFGVGVDWRGRPGKPELPGDQGHAKQRARDGRADLPCRIPVAVELGFAGEGRDAYEVLGSVLIHEPGEFRVFGARRDVERDAALQRKAEQGDRDDKSPHVAKLRSKTGFQKCTKRPAQKPWKTARPVKFVFWPPTSVMSAVIAQSRYPTPIFTPKAISFQTPARRSM